MTDVNYLTATFTLLGIAYILQSCIALVQLVRILRATASYAQSSPRLQLILMDRQRSPAPWDGLRALFEAFVPWTTQKVVHILVLAGGIARVGFIVVAITCIDGIAGTLSLSRPESVRILFYTLDALPTALFFTLYTFLALFWAELYYIAAEEIHVYRKYASPVQKAVNLLAYAVLGVIIACYATKWESYDRYANPWYAYYVFGIYIAAAIVFTWYARSVSLELKLVPIDLQMRRKKVAEVAAMTSACTSCLVLRAVMLAVIADVRIPLTSQAAMLWVLCYFLLLEVLPQLVVLFHHRKMPLPWRWQMAPDEGLRTQTEEFKPLQLADPQGAFGQA